jgi:hypothetical protein
MLPQLQKKSLMCTQYTDPLQDIQRDPWYPMKMRVLGLTIGKKILTKTFMCDLEMSKLFSKFSPFAMLLLQMLDKHPKLT